MRRARDTSARPAGESQPMSMHDIARAAGVSTATVSRALRGMPRVSAETRAKVLEVAEKLDYVVSPAASRLASGRAGSIAVVTPFIARWYFSTVLSGVEKVLRDSDTDLILFSVGEPDEHRSPTPFASCADAPTASSSSRCCPTMRTSARCASSTSRSA